MPQFTNDDVDEGYALTSADSEVFWLSGWSSDVVAAIELMVLDVHDLIKLAESLHFTNSEGLLQVWLV